MKWPGWNCSKPETEKSNSNRATHTYTRKPNGNEAKRWAEAFGSSVRFVLFRFVLSPWTWKLALHLLLWPFSAFPFAIRRLQLAFALGTDLDPWKSQLRLLNTHFSNTNAANCVCGNICTFIAFLFFLLPRIAICLSHIFAIMTNLWVRFSHTHECLFVCVRVCVCISGHSCEWLSDFWRIAAAISLACWMQKTWGKRQLKRYV